jgi:hypothetical protein
LFLGAGASRHQKDVIPEIAVLDAGPLIAFYTNQSSEIAQAFVRSRCGSASGRA